MKNIELVVFDLAGTTVKDNGNVAGCFINAFSEHGIQVPVNDVNKVMGFRKKEAITILLDKLNVTQNRDQLIESIHEAFTRSMIDFYNNDPALEPMPNAEEIFSGLREKGIKVALNTGFTKAITESILHRLNWSVPVTVDAVISSDEVPEGRPSPYMIRHLMKTLDVQQASRIVKVGDTQVDIDEGRNAGCGLVISIASGAYSKEELRRGGPDNIIDNLAQLTAFIH